MTFPSESLWYLTPYFDPFVHKIDRKIVKSGDNFSVSKLLSTVNTGEGKPMLSKLWVSILASLLALGLVFSGQVSASATSLPGEEEEEIIIVVPEEEVVPEVEVEPQVVQPRVFAARSKAAFLKAREVAPKTHKGFYRTSEYAKWYTRKHIKQRYGWGNEQFRCLTWIWGKESAWNFRAKSPSGLYRGIPQLDKKIVFANRVSLNFYMANPEIQIQLGARYIKYREGYGTPCKAMRHKERKGWY